MQICNQHGGYTDPICKRCEAQDTQNLIQTIRAFRQLAEQTNYIIPPQVITNSLLALSGGSAGDIEVIEIPSIE